MGARCPPWRASSQLIARAKGETRARARVFPLCICQTYLVQSLFEVPGTRHGVFLARRLSAGAQTAPKSRVPEGKSVAPAHPFFQPSPLSRMGAFGTPLLRRPPCELVPAGRRFTQKACFPGGRNLGFWPLPGGSRAPARPPRRGRTIARRPPGHQDVVGQLRGDRPATKTRSSY